MRVFLQGTHPTLDRVDSFIREELGYSVTYAVDADPETLDLAIIGIVPQKLSEARELIALSTYLASRSDLPVVLLSTGDLYLDRRSDLERLKKVAMGENWAISLGSIFNDNYTRLAAVAYCEGLFMENHKHVTVFRVFDCYGPGMRTGFIHYCGQSAKKGHIVLVGPGTQTRCFLYIDDFLDLIEEVIENPQPGVYNVGSTEEVSLMTVAQLAWQEVHGREPIQFSFVESPDFPWWRKPSITRVGGIFGWEPSVSIRKGVKSTIQSLL